MTERDNKFKKKTTPIEVVDVKPIDALQYLHSYQVLYKDKKGCQKTWEIVSRGPLARIQAEIHQHISVTDGTMIFATDPERQTVILLKEFRISANQWIYMLPAGLVDSDESIENAAIREFKEETGMTLKPMLVQREHFVSIGIINEKVNIVYGYYGGEPSTAFQDDNESAEILIVNREDAKRLLATEPFCMRSALLLESFFQLNPFLHDPMTV